MTTFTQLPQQYQDFKSAAIYAAYSKFQKALIIRMTVGNKRQDSEEMLLCGRECLSFVVMPMQRLSRKTVAEADQWIKNNSEQLAESYYKFLIGDPNGLEELKQDISHFPNDFL